MLTRNWYNNFKSSRTQVTIADGLTDINGKKTTAGYYSSGASNQFDAIALKPTNVVFSTNSSGVLIGSGTTPPTMDDYKLESMIDSGISASLTKVVTPEYDRGFLLTLINMSDQEITVGEVGILTLVYNGANASSTKLVLMERSLVEPAITIPPDGVGQVEYTLRLQVPEE